MDRRQSLKSTGFALPATALAGTPSRAQAAPIKVGVLAPLTGVVASGGREMVEGTQFWFNQIGNQISGRNIELAIEDDASNPDVALQKARRLVEQSNVHFLIGNLLANTGLAVANYVKGTGTPYFIPIIAADDLTQRQRIRNVIRVADIRRAPSPIRSATGRLKRDIRRSRPSARTTRSVTSNAAASPRSSPKAAARSLHSCGTRSTPRTSAPTSASSPG
jgi:hypothetical protein